MHRMNSSFTTITTLDLARKDIGECRVRQSATALITIEVTPQLVFIDSLRAIHKVSQFLRTLNMQKKENESRRDPVSCRYIEDQLCQMSSVITRESSEDIRTLWGLTTLLLAFNEACGEGLCNVADGLNDALMINQIVHLCRV